MPFKPGHSGNPRGRPPAKQALTEIMRRAGNVKVDSPGEDRLVARKKQLAELVWNAALTGEVTLPGERKILLDGKEWRHLVAFIYERIDGQPVAPVDVTSGGKAFAIHVSGIRDEPEEEADLEDEDGGGDPYNTP
jgi:hypothetical protein